MSRPWRSIHATDTAKDGCPAPRINGLSTDPVVTFRRGGRRSGSASDRQADDEARAQRFGGDVGVGRADVLGPDHAAMRFDDLLGDREPEAGVVAELLCGRSE
jgi:hypothetical protein